MPGMGRRPDTRERILGPYPHHRGWRLIVVGADGRRRPVSRESRDEIDALKAILERKISTILHTTDTARQAFVEDTGGQAMSITVKVARESLQRLMIALDGKKAAIERAVAAIAERK